MAYKFQVGAAQLSGALTQEGAVTAEGLASLDGGIDVNGSNFTVSTAGAVVAESTVSGAAGTFDALAGTSLALQDGGITNAGDISGSALTMDALAGTSLALQSGGITAAGDIAGAGDVSGSGVFSMSAIDNDGVMNNQGAANIVGKLTVTAVSDLDGGIDVNGSNFTVSTAGAVVAESTVSGAAATFDSIAGTSLALQSGGITAAGAIAGASTISGSDTLSISHVDIDGTIDAAAGAFTVNAAGNMVALSASVSTLYGSGDAHIAGELRLEDAFTMDNASITDAGAISGALALSGLSLDIEAGADIDGALTVGASNAFSVSALGNLTACPSASIADLYISDDAQFADTVLVEGAFSASAGLHITDGMGLIVGASGEAQIDAAGTLSTSGDISGSVVDFLAGDSKLAAHWLPDVDLTRNLGHANFRWNSLYVDNIVGASINVDVETGNGSWIAGSEIMLANGNLILPAGGSDNGKIVRVKNISASMVRIDANTGENFFNDADGSTTGSVELETRGAAISMVYSGSNWYIF